MAHVWTTTSRRTRGALFPAAFGLILLYVVGLDQGLLLSVVQGQTALDQNLIHELVHRSRILGAGRGSLRR
jgi:hypothetical protein